MSSVLKSCLNTNHSIVIGDNLCKSTVNSLNALRIVRHDLFLKQPLCLFLRVLRVLRGQAFCYHEEHEGHEVWTTPRSQNAPPSESFAVFARVILFPKAISCLVSLMLSVVLL